jgi:hypothetical protein
VGPRVHTAAAAAVAALPPQVFSPPGSRAASIWRT